MDGWMDGTGQDGTGPDGTGQDRIEQDELVVLSSLDYIESDGIAVSNLDWI